MTTLTTHGFQILLALSDDDRHGSGIVRRVLELTDGTVRLWPVTLYRTLDELRHAELVEELSGSGHPQGESRRRRFYRLTDTGADRLAAEADRLGQLAAVARRNLGHRGA